MLQPMVSLELDDEEQEDAVMPMPMADKPKYPYGTRICLTTPELEKLGISADEAFVGGIFHLHALAEITCVSKNEMQDGTCCERIEATITHMMVVESEDKENADAERSMGGMKRGSVLHDYK